jgi:hypothetical protein
VIDHGPVSLDCQFVIVPSVFSNVLLDTTFVWVTRNPLF